MKNKKILMIMLIGLIGTTVLVFFSSLAAGDSKI